MASKKLKHDDSFYLKKLGERIKELRLEKGFTNYEYFAYENGLSRSQFGKYENGGNIQFDTLIRILKGLDVSIEEFFSKGFD